MLNFNLAQLIEVQHHQTQQKFSSKQSCLKVNYNSNSNNSKRKHDYTVLIYVGFRMMAQLLSSFGTVRHS